MSIPKTMKAVVIEGDKAVLKDNVPVPKLTGSLVLIKTKAVAGNPTDWKHIKYKIGPQGAIVGCDAAGEIVALGPDVDKSKFAVGDTIYSIVHGSSVKHPGNGAFAEYSALDSKLSFKADLTLSGESRIPAGVVKSFEAAATLPVSIDTAGAILHHNFGNELIWEPAKPQHDFPILIWGGATGVGQMLIQIAKKINAYSKIIVVASRKHEATLKKYGADELFDYHDSDVVKQIKSKYPNVTYLVDAVSNKETIQQVYRCSADNEPVTILQLTLLSEKDIAEAERKSNVTITGTLLYSATGEEVPFGSLTLPANPEYRAKSIEFTKFITPKINAGEIYHIPVKVYRGLESVPQLLDDIEFNRNSGEKLVATLN